MTLLFMFCNNCMEKIHTKNWLVGNRRCTCIFLEEKRMTLIRRTYWTNGLITDRDLSFALEDSELMIAEQRRRVNNGPGIDRVELISKVNAGKVSMTPSGK